MSFFRNLSIRSKLQLIILLPLSILCLCMASILTDKYTIVSDDQKAADLIELSVAASELVHEVQKERGASAIYLGSKGQRFNTEMGNQRRNTDTALKAYKTVVADILAKHEEGGLRQSLDAISADLNQLENMRGKISSLSIPLPQAIGFLTALNGKMLNITAGLSDMVADVDIANRASAYFYMMQSKERAGIERAVLSGVFVKDVATAKEKEKYISLAVEQTALMQVFRKFATQVNQQEVNRVLQNPAVAEVNRMRQIAWAADSNFNVDANTWFKQATNRINLLKQAEDTLSADLIGLVNNKKDAANSIFYTVLIAAILVISATIALSVLTQRQIALQMKDIIEGLTQLGEHSNLRVKVTPRSEDDLGRLAVIFNNMVDGIRKLVDDIQQAGHSMQNTVDTMQTVSSDVRTQMVSGQDQTNMVAAAMYEMAASIQEVASNCSMAADQSNATNISAESGKELLQKTREDVNTLDSTLLETRDIIGQVASDSEEIGSVLDVIKGVSEQTNLLALNAAIEAARAGEQGRGFAVVADEVRTLAQRTRESTIRIEEMIDKLQNGSQRAVNAMTQSQEKAVATHDSIGSLVEQLTGIIDQISTINDMNTQNAAATEEQSATVNEINDNIQEIQQRYNDSADSMAQLSESSDGVQDTSQQLSASVQRFQV
ncbi:methyl-accepting chemotaxis protein [Aliamphritea hakodatensis]|uniref:methyl-accepting chemotaxis protein n=1 Tax=Aliamphritea hakodatensis TaxID=2895352 RepID=UPI0022FD6EBC|nr:nitrate- and nitrite sensing domain-containing protein [Aliamphritea hakodatensis]